LPRAYYKGDEYMKKTYSVAIHYEAPYPKTHVIGVMASGFGMAAHKAYQEFKKLKLTTKRQSKIKFNVYYTGTLEEGKADESAD
jgi:hypothetical protein